MLVEMLFSTKYIVIQVAVPSVYRMESSCTLRIESNREILMIR